jgi:membrane protein
VIASGLLTVIYMVVPNTQVRFGPALAGGIAAGILWAAIGRFFTLFVLYSSRLTVVYAGFAIIIATLVWTYFNWIILLIGAQVSFYAQNPSYLRSACTSRACPAPTPSGSRSASCIWSPSVTAPAASA